jgi:hypothetical protein
MATKVVRMTEQDIERVRRIAGLSEGTPFPWVFHEFVRLAEERLGMGRQRIRLPRDLDRDGGRA